MPFPVHNSVVKLTECMDSSTEVKEEMEPLSTEQEKSLFSDDIQNEVEEEKKGEDVEMLESGSKESMTGTNGDPSFYKEHSESIESKIKDDTGLRQSSEDGDVSIPEAVQRISVVSDSLVSPEATDNPPISDITGDSFALPSIPNKDIIASENPSEAAEDKLANINLLEPSEFDNDSEKLVTKHQNGVHLNPSSIKSSEPIAVIESSIVQEDFLESGNVLSTKDVEQATNILTMDDGQSNVLSGTVSTGAPLSPELAYQSVNEDLQNEYNDNVSQSLFDSTSPGNFFTSAGIPAPSVVSAALQAPPGKVLVPAVIDQLQSQALSALQVLKVY